LIMGPQCTRNCRFCSVQSAKPDPLDPEEPGRVAEAVQRMGLAYVVVTSVTRDDLPDGGAGHFASTIRAIRKRLPHSKIEVLVPDFQGDRRALAAILEAAPDVLNHNIETVPRLYGKVRPQADYGRSLDLLKQVKQMTADIPTKSGLMLGLGETAAELRRTLSELLSVGCDFLTLGQYLQPTREHLPVHRFVPPEEFEKLREDALRMGFREVSSGAFVRSSYHAKELFQGESDAEAAAGES
jgi:lipoic acid synthetase